MTRRWMAVIAVLAALAVIGTASALTLGRPSRASSQSRWGAAPVDAPLPQWLGEPEASAKETGSCAGPPRQHEAGETPADWATHAAIDGQPFTLRAPESWSIEDLSGIVAVGAPGGAAVITIMSNEVPGLDGADASEAADRLGPVMAGALAGQGATVDRTGAIEVDGQRACEQVGTIVADNGSTARFTLRSYIADGAFHIVYLRLGDNATAEDARSAQAVIDSFRPVDAS